MSARKYRAQVVADRDTAEEVYVRARRAAAALTAVKSAEIRVKVGADGETAVGIRFDADDDYDASLVVEALTEGAPVKVRLWRRAGRRWTPTTPR